jgi:hypothetical protein
MVTFLNVQGIPLEERLHHLNEERTYNILKEDQAIYRYWPLCAGVWFTRSITHSNVKH